MTLEKLPKSRKGAWILLVAALALVVVLGVIFFRPNGSGIALPSPSAPASAARIVIVEEGMYELTSADLGAVGWQEVDPETLLLRYQGEPYPVWITGAGRDLRIRFYGQPVNSRYTLENAYFLERCSPGECAPLMMVEGSPSEANLSPAATFVTATHLEENNLYFPKAVPERTWYWLSLPAPGAETFPFTLNGLGQGSGLIQVALYGSTEAASVDPDHHLRVLLNGTALADESWDGIGLHTIDTEIPEGVLLDGENLLTLEAPGDTGVGADIVLLDWIALETPQRPAAVANHLAINGPGGNLTLEGFDAPLVVYDVSDPFDTFRVPVEGAGADFRLATDLGRRYFAVGEEGYMSPAGVHPVQTLPALWAVSTEVDYLAVGPPELLEPLEPLLEHRESQGLRTLAVPIQTVYDEFNHGLAEPEAVRSLLQYAAANWAVAPRYLLLVGDGSHDPRGYQAPPEANWLPSFFLFSTYGGETVSDLEFVKLDEDPFPDLAVGRFPARTPEQVETAVEKTLAYENQPADEGWQRRILAISDGQEASFQRDAETFLAHFSAEFQPELYAAPAGDTSASSEIETYLEDGVLLMSYFGHGSVTQLGKDSLFSNQDGEALRNGDRLPIMVNITCLAGLFSHPQAVSLSEVMLFNPRGGAVAALGATSLTLPVDQALLSSALVEQLLVSPDARLGDLLLGAQRTLPAERAGALEVMDTFLLFGDPALQLP